MLRTNTQRSAEEVALQYKQLWRVGPLFRDTKSLLDTRSIFHQCDETICGHVFCSFPALVLRKALLERLEAGGHNFEWADVIRDRDALQQVEVTHQNKRLHIRTQARAACNAVFRAVGIALPQTVRQLSEPTPLT